MQKACCLLTPRVIASRENLFVLRKPPTLSFAQSASKRMKSITEFFPKKDGKKRSGTPILEATGASKRANTVIASAAAKDATGATGVTQLSAVEVRPAEEAEAPHQLGEEELREACQKNVEVAKLRVEQAALQQTQPGLTDLLIDESWRQHLKAEFQKPYMAKLQSFLHEEWAKQTVFPPKHLIFRAMNGTPFDQVRVVIIGQDPYHNQGQAMGLSFSVPLGQPVPSSLNNIYRELRDDCGCTNPGHGDLTKWSSQGVLLLNAALTVRAHAANSHARKGWQDFTTAAIKALSTKRKGLVFLLWGRNAQTVEPLIAVGRHHVLKSAHPSGLSASRGFFGCKHFSKANKLLEKEGLPPIDWQIPKQ